MEAGPHGRRPEPQEGSGDRRPPEHEAPAADAGAPVAPPAEPGAAPDEAPQERTVEAEVGAQVAARLGGPRGAAETALPIALFSLAYVATGEVRTAAVLGVASAVVLIGIRLAQRSSLQFVSNGLFGIVIAAVIATATGRAETAFLPGIIQSAGWAVVLGASVVVRWPLAGFLVGGVIGDTTGWRENRAVLRLSDRLTLVLMVPMVLRVAVQYPLYLAEEVGWLGVARVALGWPLTLVAFAVAAGILTRGHTPLQRPPRAGARSG